MPEIWKPPRLSGSDFLTGTKPYLDRETLSLLEAAAKGAGELGVEWMVTGAAGRVLLLEGVYGLPHGRATRDVDLGIMVESWDHYQALVTRLQEDARFSPDPKQQQRLRFGDAGLLDLVPFGGIENEGRTIRWPPDGDFAMSVLGFREAYADAVPVKLDGLIVPVVSPVGLMLLKLVVWSERHWAQPGKDAADLAYVLRHYSSILTEKVLFDEYFDTVEASGYDLDLAASRVLGKKIALLAKQDAGDFILSLLEEELLQETDSVLVRDVNGHLPGATIEKAYAVLQSLRTGLKEESKK
jgi:predicted nucleotidyltransferase